MTRNKVITQAVEQCLKELYLYVQPKVEWDDFVQQNKNYTGQDPKPFEFYYLSEEIMKNICDSYIDAYKLDSKQELLNIIEILKNYCKNPVTIGNNKEIEYLDNLELELSRIVIENDLECDEHIISKHLQNLFFKFLDMAGEFYKWDRELNTFNMSIYLGASPNSNKEVVIENWKKYRNKDIEIDEEQIKKEYYGDE